MQMADLVGFGQLGAFLTIVLMFLQHIEKKDAVTTEIHQACEMRIAAVASESKKVAEKCIQAFMENTRAINRFEDTLDRIEEQIK